MKNLNKPKLKKGRSQWDMTEAENQKLLVR